MRQFAVGVLPTFAGGVAVTCVICWVFRERIREWVRR